MTVVENQALVWLGTLYSPLLPVFGLLANVVQFYTKLLLALVAYEPPSERYSVSRTSVMAYTLMLGARPRHPAMTISLVLVRFCAAAPKLCSMMFKMSCATVVCMLRSGAAGVQRADRV